ncbi:MAG: flagellar motor switch protein FliN, partial [Sphingomonas bacterium]|nr:flagellar motor switch protein FliN [Sphingomonas bacterium]
MTEAPFPGIDDPNSPAGRNFRLLADIPLRLSVEVGSTSLKLSELL